LLREKIAVVERDRFYQPDIQRVREMMRAGEVIAALGDLE
jgi:histidine ammonia-lyase